MRFRWFAVWLIGVAAAGSLSADKGGERGVDKLQGTWSIVTHEQSGKAITKDKGATVTVSGDTFTTKVEGKTVRAGTLRVDAAKKPMHIDVTYTQGPLKGKTLQGVYALEGGTWQILYSLPGKDRPLTLAGTAGEGQVLLVLKHERP